MKKQNNDSNNAGTKGLKQEQALFDVIASLQNTHEVKQFLIDLCTPAELQAMADRWRVVKPLIAGEPYRKIHEKTAVSVTTITRVARAITYGTGGYKLAYEKLKGKNHEK